MSQLNNRKSTPTNKTGLSVSLSLAVKDRQNGTTTVLKQVCGLTLFVGLMIGLPLVMLSDTRMQQYINLETSMSTTDENRNLSSDDSDVDDSHSIKKWRQSVRDSCHSATTREAVLAIDTMNVNGFVYPDIVPERSHDHKSPDVVKRCQRVFMDFGANIGDTSSHLIDTGLIGCERNDIGKDAITPTTHFDVTDTKKIQNIAGRNKLTKNIAALLEVQNGILNKSSNALDSLGPEDYCYYGIEGNPVFTKRLQDIEDYVMSMKPRPLQHMHFFTESVGAGSDGPTKLYLDTVNSEQNFWGSSIFENHQDVRRSIDGADGDVQKIAADVTGVTIGSLMKRTLKTFSPDADPNEKNHLILKIDIEGGEYPLLWEAVEEGTLCRFVRDMGHTADLYIEFHSQRVTGKHSLAGKTKEMKERLTACGVTFRNLQAWWA
jgi:Methyltransferase FkbM domain